MHPTAFGFCKIRLYFCSGSLAFGMRASDFLLIIKGTEHRRSESSKIVDSIQIVVALAVLYETTDGNILEQHKTIIQP
jgi:hypothetical protein